MNTTRSAIVLAFAIVLATAIFRTGSGKEAALARVEDALHGGNAPEIPVATGSSTVTTPTSERLSPDESRAVAGLLALRSGDYPTAIDHLDAASAGFEGPEMTALRAAAREGAGRGREAEELARDSAVREALREVAREAFLERQDVFTAGPAYRLYLRLVPAAPQAVMMRRAIAAWENGAQGASR